MKNFNLDIQMNSIPHVWIRIHGLPMEYKRPSDVYNITKGMGFPLRIYKNTLNHDFGIYARLLVEVDCSSTLPEKIMVERKKDNYNFFMHITYEKVPNFYYNYQQLGYSSTYYRRRGTTILNQ